MAERGCTADRVGPRDANRRPEIVDHAAAVFVKFANIEEPNAISEDEARWLHEELLRGIPSEEATQAALKIQNGWENGVDVELSPDEKREVVAILNEPRLHLILNEPRLHLTL